MNCDQVPLIEFVRAELDDKGTKEVIDHLDSCAQCRERLHVLAQLAATCPRQTGLGSRNRVLLLAAGALLAVLLPLLYLEMSHSVRLEDLATSERFPARFPLLTRQPGTSDETEALRRQAHEAYQRADYESAVAVFERLPVDGETCFYLGVSQYLVGHSGKALESLEKAMKLDPGWRTAARWYRASAFLRLGREAEARRELALLLQETDDYRRKAENLLEKLKDR